MTSVPLKACRLFDQDMTTQTKIAILGCGYVANMYRLTLSMHPDLELVGVYDREGARGAHMARLTGARAYDSFQMLLDDPNSQIVLNLTNPSQHYETTRALLCAGKHVYTEKAACDAARSRAGFGGAGAGSWSAPCICALYCPQPGRANTLACCRAGHNRAVAACPCGDGGRNGPPGAGASMGK